MYSRPQQTKVKIRSSNECKRTLFGYGNIEWQEAVGCGFESHPHHNRI